MSAEPWKKWTPDDLLSTAKAEEADGYHAAAGMLRDMAALLEAEQRGERCVLPKEVSGIDISSLTSAKGWACLGGEPLRAGKGETQEAAILDLARKLRAR